MNLKDNPIKFIVIAEIHRTGFITRYFSSFKKAESFAKKLFLLSDQFQFREMYKMEELLSQNDYTKFEIKGNQKYFPECKRCTTNGAYTVSVVAINMKTFCLETFIKERENNSSAFEYLSDKFLEKFPHSDLIAN